MIYPKQDMPYYEIKGGGGQKKIYRALLTQTGTNAPTAVELENTLGDVTWTRDNPGIYRITAEDVTFTNTNFTANTIRAGEEVMVGIWTYLTGSDGTYLIVESYDLGNNSEFVGDTIADGLLSNTGIEIIVYN